MKTELIIWDAEADEEVASIEMEHDRRYEAETHAMAVRLAETICQPGQSISVYHTYTEDTNE